MFFSVIVPFFNSEKTLQNTLNSLKKQKKNYELILVNDGSFDNSNQIVNKNKVFFKCIKILNNRKNLGVSLSRNKGIKNSTGKYLIFLDSDDSLYSNSLEKLEKHIKKYKYPDVVFSKFSKSTFPKSNLSILKKCFKKKKNYFFNYILAKKIPLDECWPYVVKKKFLLTNKINFSNYRVAEDQLYVLKIFLKLKNISFFKENFYKHLNLSSSLSDFMDFNSGFYCLKVLLDYLKIRQDIKNKTLQNLCNFYIQNVLSMFTGILLQCDKKQVNKYYQIVKNKSHLFQFLISKREKFEFKKFLKKNFILLYKIYVVKKKKLILKEYIKSNNKFYIFCYSKFTAATLKILGRNRKRVLAIIDENPNLIGKKFQSYKIKNKNFLIKNMKKTHYYIIANHRDITINKIYENLLSLGVNYNKIIKFKF